MKTIVPEREAGFVGLKVAGILAGAAVFGILMLHLASKADYEKRLSATVVKNTELSRKVAEQAAALEQVSGQLGEMKRLRRENKEIHELRAASADVQRLQKENEKLMREMVVLRSQLSHAQTQATQLRETARDAQQELRQTQSVVVANTAREQRNACIANLRWIDGAKQQWALDERKSAQEIPAVAELFGQQRYIPIEPVCPTSGGRYQILAVGLPPACSHPDHKL